LSNVPCDKGIVESDCLRVVHVLNDVCQYKSPCWCLYKEGHELLRIFRHICISKVDRVSNRVAHGLAHLGKEGEVGLLHGSFPTSLEDLVLEDCNPVRSRCPLVSYVLSPPDVTISMSLGAVSFSRTLFLTRVPKGTERFLMRRLVCVYI
jgi:hypothetical protein